MQRDTLKKYYIIHSWVGVCTGILLFIIAFTGAISVFSPELKLWSNPNLHQTSVIAPEKIERLVTQYANDVPEKYLHEVMILMPGPDAYSDLIVMFETEHGPNEELIALTFNPNTLELINRVEGSPEEAFSDHKENLESFITHFHANLHLGRLGLILTGLLGLTLMASAITGIIIHRKILKELFIFRPVRSLRLLFADAHKVLSVWGILFHGMIGFTGAFLGLVTVILLPAAAFVSFQGDQEKLLETFQPEKNPVLSGEPANMQIAKTLEQSISFGGVTRSMTIFGWGDKNALAYTDTYGGDQVATQTHKFQLSTATHSESDTAFALVGGASGPILDVMFPLHFGNFGGLFVRIVWALLGLSTSLIAITGMMIWVEKRAYGSEGSLKPSTYLKLSRLTIGSCGGLLVAFSGLFWVQRLAPSFIVESFFTIWLVALVYALVRSNNYQSNRHLLGISGLLLLFVPVIDAVTLDHHLFNSLGSNHTYFAAIDFTTMLIGVLVIYLAWRLPSQRLEPIQKKEKHKKAKNNYYAPATTK